MPQIRLARWGLVALAVAVGLALVPAGVGAAPVATLSTTDLPAPTNLLPLTGSAEPGGSAEPTLVNVRTGGHDRYDRTVFDFAGGTPGYTVRYGVLGAGGTGAPIAVDGAVTVVVVFHEAFAHNVATGLATYDIHGVLNPGLPTLRQIRFGQDFEGYVSAGLGVDALGLRVLVLHDPDRIAIDVAHQGC